MPTQHTKDTSNTGTRRATGARHTPAAPTQGRRSRSEPKLAIVTDWLTNMGGAEKVVLAAHKAFPNAPIYTSVFTSDTMPAFKGINIHTTYLQKLPEFLRRRHQLFPVLRARAFARLNLKEYDVVLSIASAEAKAVRVRKEATHVCFCHTPTRYYWSHYKEYKREPGFGLLNPLIRLIIPPFVALMRRLDFRAAQGVDLFIANSTSVAGRIRKYYNQDSIVLNPPVEMQRFRNIDVSHKRRGFVVVGRQVPYKRIDLAIQACNRLKLPLTIYGNGSEHEHLQRLAGPTVKFITDATDNQVADALASAEAFIMPQEEDFGIVQIEAMAAGTPVIAFALGGSQDAVVEGKTGLFFARQTVESLTDALTRFKKTTFDHKFIQNHAEKFSEEQFIKKLQIIIDKAQARSTSK